MQQDDDHSYWMQEPRYYMLQATIQKYVNKGTKIESLLFEQG